MTSKTFTPGTVIDSAWLNDVNTATYAEYNVISYGAVCNGTTDDTAAVQAALTAAGNAGGGIVNMTKSVYCASSITVPANTTLKGSCESIGSSRGNYTNEFATPPSLRLSNTATINLSRGSTVCNLFIINKNLLAALPFANVTAGLAAVAAYAGIAINGEQVEDTYIHNCRIMGFAQAIHTNLCDRLKIEWLDIDCTAGIWTNDVYDIPRIYQVHCWPFTTYGYSFSTQSLLYYRSGAGFKLTGHFDGGTIVDSFAYGYSVGFDVQAVTGVQLLGNWVEGGGASYIAGQAGFKFTVAGDQTNMLGCGVDTCDFGVYVDCASLKLGISGCEIHANKTGIEVHTAVDVSINDNHFYYPHAAGAGSPTPWITPVAAIYLTGVGGQVSITNNYVYGSGLIPGISVLGGYANNLQVIGNKFIQCTVGLLFDGTVTGQCVVIGNSFNDTTTPYTIPPGQLFNKLVMHSNIGMSSDPIGNTYSNLSGQPASTDTAYGGGNGPRHINNYAVGTPALPTIVASGNTLMSYRAFGYDGTAFQPAGLTRIQVDGAPAAGSMPGTHIVSTTPSGAVAAIDRNATDNAGHFKPLTTNSYDLGVPGLLSWRNIYSQNAVTVTSDARAKDYITDSTLGLDFITSLRPVSYKMREGSCQVTGQDAVTGEILYTSIPGVRTHWGLIAQEVKEVIDTFGVDFAGHVLTDLNDPDSPQALRYEEFIAPLIKAVQELNAKLKELEARES